MMVLKIEDFFSKQMGYKILSIIISKIIKIFPNYDSLRNTDKLLLNLKMFMDIDKVIHYKKLTGNFKNMNFWI